LLELDREVVVKHSYCEVNIWCVNKLWLFVGFREYYFFMLVEVVLAICSLLIYWGLLPVSCNFVVSLSGLGPLCYKKIKIFVFNVLDWLFEGLRFDAVEKYTIFPKF
jgi:hypothetical protein